MENCKPKLGVLALMLEDYLPLFDGIERAQEHYVRRMLDRFRSIADFCFPHVAKNRGEIERLVREFNADQLDGILILLLTYAQGMYLVHAMQENNLPLALALVQPEQSVRTDFTEWDYTVNQGIHGSQDVMNCLLRAGIRCEVFAGNREEPDFMQFVQDFAAAAATFSGLRRMKIGVIGKLPGMGDVFTDDMAVFRVLGAELRYDSIGTVQRFCAAVDDAAIAAEIMREREWFEIDPTLEEPVFAEAVRMYLGIRDYLEAYGLSGYTLHYGECGEDGRFCQLPLLAASNLLADGYGYAAEGDSTAAVLAAAMQRLCGNANFSEMYMMDHVRNAVLMCHQGEGNWKTARRDEKPFLKNRVLSEGGLSNPPTLIFTPEPGRACVLSLTHVEGDRFRLLCAPGEIIPSDKLLYVDMPNLFFRPDSGIQRCVMGWLQNGGTHHEVVVQGDPRRRLQMLLRMQNVEYIQV